MNIPSTAHKLAISSLTILALGAIGVKLQWYSGHVGLLMLNLAGLLSFISICAAAFFTRRTHSPAGRRQLSQAAVIALPAIIFFSINLLSSAGPPSLYDISTDTENPPKFIATEQHRRADDNTLIYLASNRDLQRQVFPDIQTIPTLFDVKAAQHKARLIAENLGWQVTYQESGHIEATVASFWFGFTDDIVIRITQTRSGSIIDLRSTSRAGKDDLGANASRIRKFTEQYLK